MAKPRSHKKQHTVPASYLASWCDPNTPTDQEPYVWLFAKEGGEGKRRAPTNTFTETDFYTFKSPDGSRNLELEHGLSQLESEFAAIRRNILADHCPLADDQRLLLCVFAAAMHARTTAYRDHQRGQFGEILRKMQQMRDHMENATPEERETAAMIMRPSSSEGSMDMADVERLVEQPTQMTLASMINGHVPLLYDMDLAIYYTNSSPGFITSDNPYAVIDPEARNRPLPYNAPGLVWDTVEVTLPLSPSQMLLFNRQGYKGYRPAQGRVLDELNRRTRAFAGEHFVVDQDHVNPCWLLTDPRKDQPDT